MTAHKKRMELVGWTFNYGAFRQDTSKMDHHGGKRGQVVLPTVSADFKIPDCRLQK